MTTHTNSIVGNSKGKVNVGQPEPQMLWIVPHSILELYIRDDEEKSRPTRKVSVNDMNALGGTFTKRIGQRW